MKQTSAYETALANATNPAQVRLFLFICQRLQEEDVDTGDMVEKSGILAAGFLSIMNSNSTGYNREEVAIIFDHFMKWYETPHTDYSGKIRTRDQISWNVDYGPDVEFANILRGAANAIKEKRGPSGPQLPRSWGVGMKCRYSVSKGRADFDGNTIDHQGQLLKIEPWEKFFHSEDPQDEVIALGLQPKMPHEIQNKLFYREVVRKCNLTASDAPALLSADNYEFGKYLYESEKNVSPELKYLVFRADSLNKNSYLAQSILRGERYAKAAELLVALPQQEEFSASPKNIDTYCPLFGMIFSDKWYYDCNCKFVLVPEQRRAFALGFVEACALSIPVNDQVFGRAIAVMKKIFNPDEMAEIINKLQASKSSKSANLDWYLPFRDLQPIGTEIDPRFLTVSTKLHSSICERMGFTIDDAEMLLDRSMWGFVQHLFTISRSENFKMIDRVWLKAIDDKKEDLIFTIYDQGYPLFHEDTQYMNCSSYGEERNPFANMLKIYPNLILKSARTNAQLAPVQSAEYPQRKQRVFFCDGVLTALIDGLDNRKFVQRLQYCKVILDKLFPEDADIKERFYNCTMAKLSANGRNQEELDLFKANWP